MDEMGLSKSLMAIDARLRDGEGEKRPAFNLVVTTRSWVPSVHCMFRPGSSLPHRLERDGDECPIKSRSDVTAETIWVFFFFFMFSSLLSGVVRWAAAYPHTDRYR